MLKRLRMPSNAISTGLAGVRSAAGGRASGRAASCVRGGVGVVGGVSRKRSRKRSSRKRGVFSTRSMRAILLFSVRWLVSNRIYVPSGAQSTVPPLVLARKLIWRGVPPAAGGTPRQISFLANTNGGTVLWAPDGTYILFDTNQRTENNNIARIDLVLKTPRFREDRFRDLFRDTPPTTPTPPRTQDAARPDARPPAAERTPAKPAEIAFDGIRNRLSILQTGLDARLQQISPDGKTLLLTASAARQQNLYTFPMDELATEPPVARQVTSTSGAKTGAQFSPDGREVFYLEQGRITIATLETRLSRPHAVTAEMDVDFEQEKTEVFAEAWRYLNDNFFDPKFNGVDWKGVRERFAPHVAGAGTPDELRRVLSLMLGELNASHMGISAPVTGAEIPMC